MKKYLTAFIAIMIFSMAFRTTSGGLKTGTQAPNFNMKDINGKEVKLSDFKGKIVLIDFWASWCKQCRTDAPWLVKTNQKFQNVNFEGGNGFEIISISLDDNLADWKEAIAQDGYTWTNLSEGKKWDAEIAKLFQVGSLPANYIIDGNGKIIGKDLRGTSLENFLNSIRKK